jgi:Ca-activated chloride channel family protein
LSISSHRRLAYLPRATGSGQHTKDETMQFLWPQMLWFLLAVPALAAAYIYAQRRRHRYALRYASLSLVKDALGRGPGRRRHVPPALFLFGLAVMILAMARPVSVVTLPAQEGTVILTMDVSGSMRANDLDPSRLEAAKAAARAFVEKQPPGVRVGVVSFSDSAFVVQAPTNDKLAVLAAINRLSTQRSTAIGRALLTSVDAIFEETDAESAMGTGAFGGGSYGGRNQQGFGGSQRGQTAPPTPTPIPLPTPTPMPKGEYQPAIVVLLSDGQSNQGPGPLDVVQQVADRGIRVYTVGIGTAQGAVVSNQGRSMRASLDEVTLQRIAEATDGEYFNASTSQDLQAIYENLSTHLVFRTQEQEITALATALAALLVLAAGTLSLLWFNRLP